MTTTMNLNPMNDSAENQESQPQVNTCVNCQKQTTDDLLVPSIQRMAVAKNEKNGTEFTKLVPEDLPQFAVCEECKVPQQAYYPLASATAMVRDFQDRSDSISKALANTPTIAANEAPQLPTPEIDAETAAKEKAEAEEIVSCCFCEEEKTTRNQARVPGWMGCSMLMAGRLQHAGMTKKPFVHVGSEDLLKSGPEGYVVGPKCMEVLIPALKDAARALGSPESDIARSIKPFYVMGMIKSARMKEETKVRDDAARLQAEADRKAVADVAAKELAERTKRLKDMMTLQLPQQSRGKRR